MKKGRRTYSLRPFLIGVRFFVGWLFFFRIADIYIDVYLRPGCVAKINDVERWGKAGVDIVCIDRGDDFQKEGNVACLPDLIQHGNFVLQNCNRFSHLIFYFNVIFCAFSDFPKRKIVRCAVPSQVSDLPSSFGSKPQLFGNIVRIKVTDDFKAGTTMISSIHRRSSVKLLSQSRFNILVPLSPFSKPSLQRDALPLIAVNSNP